MFLSLLLQYTQHRVLLQSTQPALLKVQYFLFIQRLYPVLILKKPCNISIDRKKSCRCCKTSHCRCHHGSGTTCQITGQATNACIVFTCDPAVPANTTVSLCQSGPQQALADGEETLRQFKTSPFPEQFESN